MGIDYPSEAMRNTIILFMLISLITNSLTPPVEAVSNRIQLNEAIQASTTSNKTTILSIEADVDQSTEAEGIPEPPVTTAPQPPVTTTPQPPATTTATPQPTATLQPTATPQPTATETSQSDEISMPPDASVPEETPNPDSTAVPDGGSISQTGENIDQAEVLEPIEPDIRSVTLSFAGDCTIGDDDKYTWNTFDSIYKKVRDPGYFFQGVKDIFARDDFTFINFEGTFTKTTKKAVKEYRFKGDPSYINVLKGGSVEGVTLANNHSMDYLDQGFKDTAAILNDSGIPWTYFEKNFVVEIKGLKIGFLGYKGWEYENKSNKLLKDQVKAMREQGVSYIVANYHWGDQNSYVPNALQKRMAHFAIDNGVDLVIGHHPHVLQGREIYKGKPILYSLGNFCFGGAPNPSDKDTIIFQMILSFDATNRKILGTEERIIPARVSSDTWRNDYRPVLATGDEEKRILEKFERISKQIK